MRIRLPCISLIQNDEFSIYISHIINSKEDMSGNNTLKPFLNEEKWGYKDNKGNIIVSPMWDYADNFYEDFAVGKIIPHKQFPDSIIEKELNIESIFDLPIVI